MNNSSTLDLSKSHGEHEYPRYENAGSEPRVHTTDIRSAYVNGDPLGAATVGAAPVPPRRTRSSGVPGAAFDDVPLGISAAARRDLPHSGRGGVPYFPLVVVPAEYSMGKNSRSGVGCVASVHDGVIKKISVSNLSSPESSCEHENRMRQVSNSFPVESDCCLSGHTGRGDAP